MRARFLDAATAVLVALGLAAAAEAPLDSSEPLPAELQPQLNEILDFVEPQLVPSDAQEQKLKACWFETLRAPDGDDRIVPWTRICPHAGPAGLICRETSVGEAKLGELIRKADDVPGANQRLERKFVLHLKSDLFVKRTHLPAEKNPERDYAIYWAHLAALRQDALLAMRSVGEQPGAAYQAIRDWIEARKRDPKSFYRCLALEG